MAVLKMNFQLLLSVLLVVGAAGERSIVTGPSNETVSIGESVTFTCVVTGDSDEETYVAWRQNDREITEDYQVSLGKVDTQRYSVTSDVVGQEYNLRIRSVKALDAGMYACAILSRMNLGQTVASSPSVWLSYKSPPRDNYPECTPSAASEVTYNEGDEVTFSCRSEQAEPPVELSWLGLDTDDATEYTQGKFIVSEFTKVLTREDNGQTFECDLSHELVTDDRSCVISKLNVQYPPTDVTLVSEVGDELGVEVGDTVSINCKADANPPIDVSAITWHPSPDIPQEKIHVSDQVLVITEVTRSMNGKIVECVVQNDLGKARGSYTLRVMAPSTKAATRKPTTSTVLSKSTSSSTTVFRSTKKLINTLSTKAGGSTQKLPALPKTKYTTDYPKLTLDKILGVERNFLIALIVGACFLLLCFVLLLLLVFGKKRTKTIVVVNSEDNLHKSSLSAASVNGNKVILTPVMTRRNRNGSDNPSDDQSFDSAIHLISPVTPGDQPDYRRQVINRSRSNISAASSQVSGTGYIRVPSTELLINSHTQQRVDQPRYVVLDLLNQHGAPFPRADSGEVNYNSATTGRVRGRQLDNKDTGFETIPMRSRNRHQGEKLYILQGDQYIPVQHVSEQPSPDGSNRPVKILIGGSDNSSDEDLTSQEGISLLDQQKRPV